MKWTVAIDARLTMTVYGRRKVHTAMQAAKRSLRRNLRGNLLLDRFDIKGMSVRKAK